ncbi:MAG: ABC-F family ATP-binding cassette domain-containing protein, partial [Acetobacteraceae bacterium]
MSLLTLKDAGITLGAPLFRTLHLTLHPGDRLALVAPNGRGKSTLLQAIADLGDLTEGQIIRRRGLVTGLLAQEVPAGFAALAVRDVVLSAVEDGQDWRADIALDEMEVPQPLRDKPLTDLSGGWQRLVLLARVWVAEP